MTKRDTCTQREAVLDGALAAALDSLDLMIEENRKLRGTTRTCGHPLGTRPSWMSPWQYDPCRCDLKPDHDGDHECEHLREGTSDG